MLRTLLPILVAGVLAGCTSAKGPVGVWLVSLGYVVEEGEGTRTVTHNYLNAVPEATEDTDIPYWTDEETRELSDGLIFAEIFEYDGQDFEYVLVAEVPPLMMLMPGAEQEDGTYLFTWTNFVHETDSETHAAGYNFTETWDEDLIWTASLDLSEPVGTGTFELASRNLRAYSETDLWDYMEVGLATGQTPAEDYLDSTVADFVNNEASTTDCTATPCSLSSLREAALTMDVTLTRTSVREGDFESVSGVSHDPGVEGPF